VFFPATEMEHLSLVEYGPVLVDWRFSRVADRHKVVEKLQLVLPEGTQFFGFYGLLSEESSHNYYVYRMMLWPPGLLKLTRGELQLHFQEDHSRSDGVKEWKRCLQLMVTELDTLSLDFPLKKDALVDYFERLRWQRPVWDMKSCGDGVDAIQFVKRFVRDERSRLENKVVFFGKVVFEYELHGQKWRETHCATVDGRYAGVEESVAG